MAQALAPEIARHGHYIFVYNNIRTNQVIYSLTRTLNVFFPHKSVSTNPLTLLLNQNHASLRQLPFLGKKSVPAKLRKDLWNPLALVSFPSPPQGLAAFRKLREFRRLHETSYPLSLIEEPTNDAGKEKDAYKPQQKTLLGTKKRGKVLMNQKANSVADIAAVLIQQARPPSPERLARSNIRIKNATRLKRAKGASVLKNPLPATELQGSVEGVRIRWANLLDAGFAATWPEEVVHDSLETARYAAAWPPLPEAVREKVEKGRESFLGVVEGAGVEERGNVRGSEALDKLIGQEAPKKGLKERILGSFKREEKGEEKRV